MLTIQWDLWFSFSGQYPDHDDEHQDLHQAPGCGGWIGSTAFTRSVLIQRNHIVHLLEPGVMTSPQLSSYQYQSSFCFISSTCNELSSDFLCFECKVWQGNWSKERGSCEGDRARESEVQYYKNHKTQHITSPHLVIINWGVCVLWDCACRRVCVCAHLVCMHVYVSDNMIVWTLGVCFGVCVSTNLRLTAVKGRNSEAQFGSSGPAHGERERETEKEESYRTRSSCFHLGPSLRPSFSTERGEKEAVCVCVCVRGEVVFLLALGIQPEPEGPPRHHLFG